MRSNYIHFTSPQFRLLSDKQMEELHLATLQVLEKTGVAFDCQEAIDILGEAGADVSDPQRVKIPSYLVEQALRTAPKSITLYTREGEPAMVLDGMTGSYFGAMPDSPDYLDPYTRQQRPCYVEDVADTARLIDALPNITWSYTTGAYSSLPGVIADKVSLLQVVLNSSKPVACCLDGVSSLS
ncbi:Glycine betaine methyltransferase [subsurface metagenome]